TFHRLGVRTTIVQRGPRLLPREDVEISEFLGHQLRNEGVTVMTNSMTTAARRVNGAVELTINGTKVTAGALLICSGRRSNVESINLEKGGGGAGGTGIK